MKGKAWVVRENNHTTFASKDVIRVDTKKLLPNIVYSGDCAARRKK